jgi:hypothetical protein
VAPRGNGRPGQTSMPLPARPVPPPWPPSERHDRPWRRRPAQSAPAGPSAGRTSAVISL